jgi:hypothetical protein
MSGLRYAVEGKAEDGDVPQLPDGNIEEPRSANGVCTADGEEEKHG